MQKKSGEPGVERGSVRINSPVENKRTGFGPGESRGQGLDYGSVVVLGGDFKGSANKPLGGDQMNHQEFQLKPFG